MAEALPPGSVARGSGQGDVGVLILVSGNFFAAPTRPNRWASFDEFLAHDVHVHTYFGLIAGLLRDSRLDATIVNVEALYRARGPDGLVQALAEAVPAAPAYVVLEGGAKPFCLTAADLAGLKRRWPGTQIILLGQDEVTEFGDHTWCFAEAVDLIISLDGTIGWGEAYRARWAFMHLVSIGVFRGSEADRASARSSQVCLFGKAKANRFQLIERLRGAGVNVATNIEDDRRWTRVDDRDYVTELHRSVYTIAPLRPYRGDQFHLIGRVWEAMIAGSVPLVDDCALIRAYSPCFGPFATFRTEDDLVAAVLRPASDQPARDAVLRRYSAEALFDFMAGRATAQGTRDALETSALRAASESACPRFRIRAKKLVRERLRWARYWLGRGRIGRAGREVGHALDILWRRFTYH